MQIRLFEYSKFEANITYDKLCANQTGNSIRQFGDKNVHRNYLDRIYVLVS